MSTSDPVQIRLVGPRDAVAARLADLAAAFTLTHVSEPLPTRSKSFPGVLVYATISRRYPLTGGTK
jgi:hypothetical protein